MLGHSTRQPRGIRRPVRARTGPCRYRADFPRITYRVVARSTPPTFIRLAVPAPATRRQPLAPLAGVQGQAPRVDRSNFFGMAF